MRMVTSLDASYDGYHNPYSGTESAVTNGNIQLLSRNSVRNDLEKLLVVGCSRDLFPSFLLVFGQTFCICYDIGRNFNLFNTLVKDNSSVTYPFCFRGCTIRASVGRSKPAGYSSSDVNHQCDRPARAWCTRDNVGGALNLNVIVNRITNLWLV